MEGLFKTSAVGGFRKEDVLAYIDRQDIDYREKERTLNNRITELTKELDQVKKENGALQSKISGLEADLETEKEKARLLKTQNEEITAHAENAENTCERIKTDLESEKITTSGLRQKAEESAQTLKDKDRMIAGLQAEINNLKEAISKKTDSEDRIGRVMMEAQNTADKMINAAQQKSDAILSEAKEKMRQLLRQAADFKSEISNLRSGASDTFRKVDELLKDIEDSAATVSEEYTDAFDSNLSDGPVETESLKETATGWSSFDFSVNPTKDEESEE